MACCALRVVWANRWHCCYLDGVFVWQPGCWLQFVLCGVDLRQAHLHRWAWCVWVAFQVYCIQDMTYAVALCGASGAVLPAGEVCVVLLWPFTGCIPISSCRKHSVVQLASKAAYRRHGRYRCNSSKVEGSHCYAKVALEHREGDRTCFQCTCRCCCLWCFPLLGFRALLVSSWVHLSICYPPFCRVLPCCNSRCFSDRQAA